MPRRLAERAKSLTRIHVFPIPIKLSETEIAVAWHPRFQHDPLHHWVRECLFEEVASSNTSRYSEAQEPDPRLQAPSV